MSELMRDTLAHVAPGTELRDGLERILRGRTGALIVLGYNDVVESICTGGFELDVPFSATRLRELAKMDGAVVIDTERNRIVRAAVQLLPDSAIQTTESGTRHRTAERVAIQSKFPIISVSQSMHIVALYAGGQRYVLEDSEQILTRANQALATLERYKIRLDEVSGTLSALEIEDLVTVRDVVSVAQRLEMVHRICEEISSYIVELGNNGRLLQLQFDELVSALNPDLELILRDYIDDRAGIRLNEAKKQLAALDSGDLIDLTQFAKIIGLGGARGEDLDAAVSPRGYRILSKIPRLPQTVINALINHFSSLQSLLTATAEDLETVEGVGAYRARMVREGLSRQAEASLLERFI